MVSYEIYLLLVLSSMFESILLLTDCTPGVFSYKVAGLLFPFLFPSYLPSLDTLLNKEGNKSTVDGRRKKNGIQTDLKIIETQFL